jgi:pyruvate/2-oxoglutarate/acetoin dehydrogenase E1 component
VIRRLRASTQRRPLPRTPPRLYWSKAQVSLPVAAGPIGTAAVRREGKDATLIAYGPSVPVALEAAQHGAELGYDLEVVDLRSLVPFDDATVAASVVRTGRAIVVHEAAGFAGFGAEIAARVAERCFYSLEAPVLRVTGLDLPYPRPNSNTGSCHLWIASSTPSNAPWPPDKRRFGYRLEIGQECDRIGAIATAT